jgi:preprotein translocase subunit SecA
MDLGAARPTSGVDAFQPIVMSSLASDFGASQHYPQRQDPPAQTGLNLSAWWAQRVASLTRQLTTPWSQRGALARQQLQVQTVLRRMTLVAGTVTGAMLTTQTALTHLRARLAHHGLTPAMTCEALALVARLGEQVLERKPYPSQLHAALVMLDGQLAEMATGEGKTYAAALAAAVSALAGTPVHLMTANDYLVQRDAQALMPLYSALGLTVGVVVSTSTPAERRAAYRCDITYCTAREVAFDYLRDARAGHATQSDLQRRAARLTQQANASEGPLLRGLHMALIDEADSLLIDEAAIPLRLSEAAPMNQQTDPAAQQRALSFQTLSVARQLVLGRDVLFDATARKVTWTATGQERLAVLVEPLGGVWLNRRHCTDLIETALQALHGLQRDRDYLVRDKQLLLLDPVTGRVADGRVWSRGLQALVELKENCTLTAPNQIAAQISLQRFFGRYLKVAGMSGTLHECRGEVLRGYGRAVVPVALRVASKRVRHADRLFANSAQRLKAVVARVAELHASGRPVLVGCDSVQSTQKMCIALRAAGLQPARLDARHDELEADIIAAAGQLGALTVTTHMAGRGADIALGDGVAALGGLHVLCCQDNRSARLDRQLLGRSARAGDPGSGEVWRVLDAAAWQPDSGWPGWADRLVRAAAARQLSRRSQGQQLSRRSQGQQLSRRSQGQPLSRRSQGQQLSRRSQGQQLSRRSSESTAHRYQNRHPESPSAVSPGNSPWLEGWGAWFSWRQKREEARCERRRRQLLEQDLEWHTRTGKTP